MSLSYFDIVFPQENKQTKEENGFLSEGSVWLLQDLSFVVL